MRRRLSVILQQGRRAVLVCKGAMEETLAQCTHLQDGEDIVPLEEGCVGPGLSICVCMRGCWAVGLGSDEVQAVPESHPKFLSNW